MRLKLWTVPLTGQRMASPLHLSSTALAALFCLSTAIFFMAQPLSFSQKVQQPEQKNQQEKRYILPELAKPLEYELSVEPDFSKFTFAGDEKIKIELLKASNEIVLNAIELSIQAAELKPIGHGANPQTIVLQPKFDSSAETVHLTSSKPIQAGTYELHCRFTGTLNHQLRGLYRSSFEDDKHKIHWIAATQMEPTDARRMFPCFDEPAYKAIFRLRCTIQKEFTAISNAPVESEKDLGSKNKKLLTFAATPKMSTYLLALIIGEFKSIGQTMAGPVPIKVWAVSGKESLGKFAQSQAAAIFNYETKYFGIPYFGKKLDLIALPELGMFSAMENAGAITFHDTAILVDESSSSSSRRLGIISVMAHEMAHQWFGDLVTMKWWDDLWLNESFATWMSTKTVGALYPHSEASTNAVYSRYGSMSIDSLKASRAIHAAVVNPGQAVEMFDGITYQKGAAVLRMLESAVGANAFQVGIHNYLKDHALGNATAADLWNAIGAQAKSIPVSDIVKSFVFQPGFPQVKASIQAPFSTVSLSQFRHLQTGADNKGTAVWQIPVALRLLLPPNPNAEVVSSMLDTTCLTLGKKQQSFDISNKSGKPILLNAGANGYYQTCYDEKYLKTLQDNFESLSEEEKIMLLSDNKSLVASGDIQIEDYLNFVHLLPRESNPMIQADLVYILASPEDFMTSKEERKAYENLLCKELLPLKLKLRSWMQNPAESAKSHELRQTVLSILGTYGQDKGTITEAFAMFQKYLKEKKSVDPDLVSDMLQIVTYNGGIKEYDALLKLYTTSTNPTDKEIALHSLAEFHQAELAKRTLALAMGNEVKLKAGIGLIYQLAFNKFTNEIALAFIKAHWDEILHRFPPESLRGLAGIGDAFDSKEKEKELSDWYATHKVPFANARVTRTLESLHARVLYREKYSTRVKQWVAKEALKFH